MMSKKAFTQAPLPFHGDSLSSYLKVYNRRTGRELGYLGNISTNGLMLITRWRMQCEAEFNMRIVLPEPMLGKKYVDFDARCQWCRPDIDAESFDSGYVVLTSTVNYDLLISALQYYFSFSDD
ncbi:PilZ domain-containing protein [Parendozoicomonas sp. Alg238-R29]|uniref:PilZ domain-containing protein n=1 Tax=Parendozoicomonas sp. Alg238-R29 TaxID=2993446 RepID=UPI00248E8715|nr:PilZ domain-containing protein [Parendozoicomonas sp. Alg238-R29]